MNLNRFVIKGNIAELKTRHGVLMMDKDDLCLLHLAELEIKDGYARIRNRKTKQRQRLHRLIMNVSEDMLVDHINHNTLDNRRCNLRICTKSENCRKNVGHSKRQSKYKGVVFAPYSSVKGKLWRAYTRIKGKRLWFGYHVTEEDAAMAYNENALKLFGEYACLNAL